jgi:putative membrane protein
MKLLIEILLMGVAVVIVAILLAFANATIGFILRVLTFPINFLTLGLMSFIITVLMVLLVDKIMVGFHTQGFLSAMLFALVLSIIKMIFGSLDEKEA